MRSPSSRHGHSHDALDFVFSSVTPTDLIPLPRNQMSARQTWRHPYTPFSRRSTNSILQRPSLCLPFLVAILAIFTINQQPLSRKLRSSPHGPPHSNFPPPLSQHFSHLHRPPFHHLPSSPDWRRPSVLTAHARPDGSKHYILTIFTTGTDAGWFQRDLKLVGCAIDEQLYPARFVHPETVACRLDHLPHIGAIVTALLAWDQTLQSAIRNPHWIAGVSFPILQSDVRPANSTLDGQRVAFVHSQLRWYPQLFDLPRVGQPRYELCIMTQIKHDAHLLPDWLSFYRRLGVDKFFLYDNHAPSDLTSFASAYVEVVYWPWTRAQSQAYTHFLLASKVRCKYSAFFDVDEYAFIGGDEGNMLKAYMDHRIKQGYGQAVFPQLQMNSNGYIKRPRGPVPELYTRVEEYQRGFGVKPILRTDLRWQTHRINQAWGDRAPTYFNTSVIPSPKTYDDNAIIVHYLSRSWEEFVDKKREGSTAVTEKYFPPVELNVSNPQAWYLSQAHSSDMVEFRTFWRRVMRMKDSGEITVTWNENNHSCWQAHCLVCLFRSVGKTWCEHR